MRRGLVWIILIDVMATMAFWAFSRLGDDHKSLSGGAGIVFYTADRELATQRLATGLALLEAGKIDQMVMVGGHRPQDGLTGSQDMALAAIRAGGPGDRITADVTSRDTISGLENAEVIAAEAQAERLVFISGCLHLMRVGYVYRSLHDAPLPYQTACAPGSRNPLRIWQTVHYEWVAWAVTLMPDSLREGLLDRLRGAEDMPA